VNGERGFTLIELMVAIVIMTVGLLALGASTGAVTSTLTGSREATVASQVATRRLEILRNIASATRPRCQHGEFASSPSSVMTQGVKESWVVPATGWSRRILIITSYPVSRGKTRVDTLATNLEC